MPAIRTYREGEVLVIVADNPPVNALSAEVRQGLVDALAEARSDTCVEAVVIRADGRTFFSGADITEFGKPPLEPLLPQVIDLIEALPQPTVAAIHGSALGGGLEIALGCNYRVMASSAKMGLPEVKLGLLPGAGGTQRLPRLVGPEAALTMIVTGDPVTAEQAQAMGLADRIVDSDHLEAEAISFARSAIDKREHPVTSRRQDKLENVPSTLFDDFRTRNARRFSGFAAPAACLEAVRAAMVLPFDEGMKKERELFRTLVTSPQSAALRHAFFAERAAAKIDGLPQETSLLAIRKVGIIGAGTMGGGIAMNFLSAGYDVVLVERERAALDHGVAIIRKNYEATAAKGRLTRDQVETAMGHLKGSLDYQDFADCDLVIEAVFELMEVKKQVFGTLDQICKPGAILASNTSYLDIDEIACATRRPEWVIGLHFFSPANVMRLLEIVRGAKTAPEVLRTSMDLARKIGKVAVVSRVCHGFIGNRMLSPRQIGAAALLMEGARPAQIDDVLLAFGFPMGPFQMADLAGLDLGWKAEESKSATIREVLCERGRRGQKTGKGYYDYDEKRTRTSSAEVDAIIAQFAAASGREQRAIDDQEILERLLYPMVNEGALILEEGIAQRAGDIDTVWLNGYGWPAYTGGPMFWADSIGLDTVLAGLERHKGNIPSLKISELLREKAAAGAKFNG